MCYRHVRGSSWPSPVLRVRILIFWAIGSLDVHPIALRPPTVDTWDASRATSRVIPLPAKRNLPPMCWVRPSRLPARTSPGVIPRPNHWWRPSNRGTLMLYSKACDRIFARACPVWRPKKRSAVIWAPAAGSTRSGFLPGLCNHMATTPRFRLRCATAGSPCIRKIDRSWVNAVNSSLGLTPIGLSSLRSSSFFEGWCHVRNVSPGPVGNRSFR